MNCGIYEIRNVHSGVRYIGSSIDIPSRLNQHRKMLLKGDHHSVYLQRAWNRHGEGSFAFNVLAYLEKYDLKETEKRFIESEMELGSYNVSKDPTSPMRGLKHTEEWIEKSKAWKLGNKSRTGIPSHWKGKKLSAMHSANISLSKQNISAETRIKMRNAKVGKAPVNKGVYSDICIRGHEVSGGNLYLYVGKNRTRHICKTCVSLRDKMRIHLAKEKSSAPG